ncbi:hypothetical protein C8A05DRAFT_31286 [Staphylotrichum tortipilum]|uniref:Zn(2)-C6 fungal-type domain-containing protein n=1 Tax=Staphylotrichum tortipilum TaxID=2831512 RepID=A0AAN6MS06_9PEZI|nr:hypothetical protein C8A05DRAFT_31286 [Staphylotrichum longicolle]
MDDGHDLQPPPPLCPPPSAPTATTTATADDEAGLARLMGSMQPRHRRQQYVFRPARQFRRAANKFACFKCQKKKTTCDGARPTCGECIQRSEIRCRYPYVPRREEARATGYQQQQQPPTGMKLMEGNRSPGARSSSSSMQPTGRERRDPLLGYYTRREEEEAPRSFGDIDALLAAPFLAGEGAASEAGAASEVGLTVGEEDEGEGFGDGLG